MFVIRNEMKTMVRRNYNCCIVFAFFSVVVCLSLLGVSRLDVPPRIVVSSFPRDRWPESQWLTERVATEATRACLATAYANASEWEFLPDERTMAPDGSRDHVLCRNIDNPNRGFLAIVDPMQGGRIAIVEMNETHVLVEIVMPK